ncbi:MAG: hypothetical protein ACLP1X_09640 [Polyangiaceae bacterium]
MDPELEPAPELELDVDPELEPAPELELDVDPEVEPAPELDPDDPPEALTDDPDEPLNEASSSGDLLDAPDEAPLEPTLDPEGAAVLEEPDPQAKARIGTASAKTTPVQGGMGEVFIVRPADGGPSCFVAVAPPVEIRHGICTDRRPPSFKTTPSPSRLGSAWVLNTRRGVRRRINGPH